MSVELASGFTRDEVETRYERYAREHHGDIDIPGLCETMVAFGERRAIATMTEFSDILPQVSRIELRVKAIRALLLLILNEAEDIEQEAMPF
jgi:hypothetical protein